MSGGTRAPKRPEPLWFILCLCDSNPAFRDLWGFLFVCSGFCLFFVFFVLSPETLLDNETLLNPESADTPLIAATCLLASDLRVAVLARIWQCYSPFR